MQENLFDEFEWTDVEPFKQYDGKPPIMDIKYPPEYEKLMNYFRAIIKSGEISQRVYKLTAKVIDNLPSNYNVWFVRRKCIDQLNIELDQEIAYLNEVSDGNEKVYQIWEYRRQLIDKRNSFQGELEFLKKVFDIDNKNYHTWSYRIWLCSRFNLFDEEIKNIEYYINEDIGNNSAWSYRYFLLKSRMNSDLLKKELEYIFDMINKKPQNESAWNYLKGWFRVYQFSKLKSENQFLDSQQFQFKDFPEVEQFVRNYQDNRFALSVLINILLLKNDDDSIKESILITEKLEKTYDIFRERYWVWYRENIKNEQFIK